MEKRGVIEEGRTPPERSLQPADNCHDKQSAAPDLEDHVTKRASDAVKDDLKQPER